MFDPVYETLIDLFEDLETLGPGNFEDRLAEYGFMIVPIDDPTNLRFGVEDDGLAD